MRVLLSGSRQFSQLIEAVPVVGRRVLAALAERLREAERARLNTECVRGGPRWMRFGAGWPPTRVSSEGYRVGGIPGRLLPLPSSGLGGPSCPETARFFCLAPAPGYCVEVGTLDRAVLLREDAAWAGATPPFRDGFACQEESPAERRRPHLRLVLDRMT